MSNSEPKPGQFPSEEGQEGEMKRGHYFELLDRTQVAELYLEAALGNHPVLNKHPEYLEQYNIAIEALARLYQMVGEHPRTFE